MTGKSKPVTELTEADFVVNPVWEFTEGPDGDETEVRPARRIPVANGDGRLFGTQVTLANGERVWALLTGLETKRWHVNQHFLAISIYKSGYRFSLARYHDFDIDKNGPDSLAAFLGLKVDEVFPIGYDVSTLSRGDARALRGSITATPSERLTKDEILDLSLED